MMIAMSVIKFVTKPIWKPVMRLWAEMKKAVPDLSKSFMRAMRDEDGTDIWCSFAMFSIVVFFLTLGLTPFTVPYKVPFTIAFCIIISIYLAIYYTRDCIEISKP
jgi:hypothetical protein